MRSSRHDREAFRFDARYGRLMRKAGIGTIPFAIYHYQAELELTPQEVWLIGYVLSHRWTSELPFPAVREIARRSGVSTKTIEKYKKGLESKGYLEVVRRTRLDGGNTSIGWDFSPLFERIDQLITRDVDYWSRRNPQFLAEDRSSPADGGWDNPVDMSVDNSVPVRDAAHGPVVEGSHGGHESASHGAGEDGSHGPRSAGRTHVEEDPDGEEFEHPDTVRAVKAGKKPFRVAASSNSNDPASTGPPLDPVQHGPGSTPVAVSPFIDRVVADYSIRLHDAPRSVRSNCTRARRLWTGSGLPEDDFVGLLHEAYQRTQDHAQRIRKSAQDGPHGTKNKLPYFFAVLESLLDAGQN